MGHKDSDYGQSLQMNDFKYSTEVHLKTLYTKFSNSCCFSTMYQISLIQISF